MKKKIPVSLPDGYVDFYKNLENWQNQQQIKLKKDYVPAELDIPGILASTNRPVLQSVDFPLDEADFKAMYQGLLHFLKEQRPEISDVLGKIEDKLAGMDFSLMPLKIMEEDQVYYNELASRLDVSPELLIFTADHTLRPWLRLWAEPYYAVIAGDEFKSWNFPSTCPFCGSKSHFSRLRAADGRRFMFCDRCFAEWETRNLFCVHCGNDNPQSIQILTIDEFPVYQVFTCNECKGYLKTFDERPQGDQTDMFIANIETIFLDMLAQEKGFTSHDNE